MASSTLGNQMLEEAADVLSVAASNLRSSPEWSLPLIAIVAARLLPDTCKQDPRWTAIKSVFDSAPVDHNHMTDVQELLDTLNDLWVDRLRALRDQYTSAQDLSGALQACDRILKSGRSLPADFVTTAHLQAQAGLLDQAVSTVESAPADLHRDGEFYRFCASVLERLNRIEEALRAIVTARTLTPGHDAIEADFQRILRARCHELVVERDNSSSTIAALAAAVELDKLGLASGTDLARMAHLQSDLGRTKEALVAIDRAIILANDDSEVHRLRASLLERLENYRDALLSIREAINRNPNEQALRVDRRRIRTKSLLKLLSRVEHMPWMATWKQV